MSTNGIGYKTFQHDIDEPTYQVMSSADTLYIDTEAMGLNIMRDRLCLVQILSNNSNTVALIQIDANVQQCPYLKALLENAAICKVFHYAPFDMAMIQRYLNISIVNVICTRILSKIVRTFTDRHGLQGLCRDLLGVNLVKDSQASNWGASELTDQQKSYAANDVIYLKSILSTLKNIALRENRWQLAEKAFSTLPAAVYLQINGFSLPDLINH